MQGSSISKIDMPGPGLYGKVSNKGDFVSRRLSSSFIDTWDKWLQISMYKSREQVGNDWLPAYLTAPIWRFLLSADICDGVAMSGIMMPSIDRVGRHFPLTLAAALPDCDDPFGTIDVAADWYMRIEGLALATLEEDFDFDEFDKSLEQCRLPPCRTVDLSEGSVSTHWWFSIDPTQSKIGADSVISSRLLTKTLPMFSLWWTDGSERVNPSLLIAPGLPDASVFTAFLGANPTGGETATQSIDAILGGPDAL